MSKLFQETILNSSVKCAIISIIVALNTMSSGVITALIMLLTRLGMHRLCAQNAARRIGCMTDSRRHKLTIRLPTVRAIRCHIIRILSCNIQAMLKWHITIPQIILIFQSSIQECAVINAPLTILGMHNRFFLKDHNQSQAHS